MATGKKTPAVISFNHTASLRLVVLLEQQCNILQEMVSLIRASILERTTRKKTGKKEG